MKWSYSLLLASSVLSFAGCRTAGSDSATASDDGTAMPSDPNAPTPLLSDKVDPTLAREIYERIKYQLTAEDADAEIQVGEFEAFNFQVVRAYDPTIGASQGDAANDANKAVISINGAYMTLDMDVTTGEPKQLCFNFAGTIDVARNGEALALPMDARANYDGQPTGCG